MLAQTNLQLYRQLLAAGWSDESLVRARAAYDLARGLFGDAYRPSHKPFVCHLVGAASAACHWEAAEPIVLASLVHSAYVLGDFGDGERGTTPRRRRFVAEAIGAEAEELVDRYKRETYRDDPAVRLVRLADRLDELSDAGPLVAGGKEVGDMRADQLSRQACLAEADELVGPRAVTMFRDAFASLDSTKLPAGLVTTDRAFHRVESGRLAISRGPVGRRWTRAKDSIARRWAA
ncbi:MAG: DUF6817 domain-containing protein [Planctomycetota bacterium]